VTATCFPIGYLQSIFLDFPHCSRTSPSLSSTSCMAFNRIYSWTLVLPLNHVTVRCVHAVSTTLLELPPIFSVFHFHVFFFFLPPPDFDDAFFMSRMRRGLPPSRSGCEITQPPPRGMRTKRSPFFLIPRLWTYHTPEGPFLVAAEPDL